ncbi:MAG: type 4a pilus biogenesis protein PilO [Phycisphaerae bacterium]|nr:type 4a pilus biogenesis protein PilO [Phycisphaerae bacterium]
MQISSKPRIFDVDLYGLAAIVILCGVFYLGVIQSLEGRCVQQEHACQVNLQEAQSSREKLAQLQSMKQQRQSLMSQLSHTRDVLQDNAGTAELVRQLGRLAAACHIRLVEIVPGNAIVGPHCERRGIELKLNGTFGQLQLLVSALADKLEFARLSNLQVVREMTSQSQDKFNASECDIIINLDVFSPR